MEPKVPLAVKKELRDQEPGLKKGLERLKKITGVEWTLDPNPNYATIYTELDKAGSGAKETMAKSIYGDEKTSYLASFASCLEAKLKDDMIKQAFLRDTPKHKIVFEFSTDENKDKPIEIADGQVTIRTEIRYFGSWMGTYTDFKLETILASDGISTAHLVEIRDSEPKKLKHLAKLKKATGVDWTFEPVGGWIRVYTALKEANKSEPSVDLGAKVQGNDNSYLGSIATLIENKMKDDLIKTAFLRDTSTRKIVFEFSTDENKDSPIELADGQVVVRTEIRYFGSWMGTYTDFKLENIMVTGGLPVAHNAEIRDQEPKKLKLLARIKKATGVDWTFEPVGGWEHVYETLKKANGDKNPELGIGAKLIGADNSYLGSIATLFEKSCKDDMIKEAVVDAAKNKKIIFEFSTDENKDKPIEFSDGNLVVRTETRYFGSWMGTYTDFKLENIL